MWPVYVTDLDVFIDWIDILVGGECYGRLLLLQTSILARKWRRSESILKGLVKCIIRALLF